MAGTHGRTVEQLLSSANDTLYANAATWLPFGRATTSAPIAAPIIAHKMLLGATGLCVAAAGVLSLLTIRSLLRRARSVSTLRDLCTLSADSHALRHI